MKNIFQVEYSIKEPSNKDYLWINANDNNLYLFYNGNWNNLNSIDIKDIISSGTQSDRQHITHPKQGMVFIEKNDGAYNKIYIYNNNNWEEFVGSANLNIHICTSAEYDHTTYEPTIQTPHENVFYLVPNGKKKDLYTEWIWVDNDWEIFGSAKIDISGKQDKTDPNIIQGDHTVVGAINDLNTTTTQLRTIVAKKQDRETESLETDNKRIVGAINEVKARADNAHEKIGDINLILADKQNSIDNSILGDVKSVVGAINANKTNIESKQDSEDQNLQTSNKTVVGAINELKSTIAGNSNVELWQASFQNETYAFTCTAKGQTNLTPVQFCQYILTNYENYQNALPVLLFNNKVYSCEQILKETDTTTEPATQTLTFDFATHSIDEFNALTLQYFAGRFDGTTATITQNNTPVYETDAFLWNSRTGSNARFSNTKRGLDNINLQTFCQYIIQNRNKYNATPLFILANNSNAWYDIYTPISLRPISQITENAITENAFEIKFSCMNLITTGTIPTGITGKRLTLSCSDMTTSPTCAISVISDAEVLSKMIYTIEGDPLTQTPQQIWTAASKSWSSFAQNTWADIYQRDVYTHDPVLFIYDPTSHNSYSFQLINYKADGGGNNRATTHLTFSCVAHTDDNKTQIITLIYDATNCPNGQFNIDTLPQEAIIDVNALPAQNIQENTLYRMFVAQYKYNGNTLDNDYITFYDIANATIDATHTITKDGIVDTTDPNNPITTAWTDALLEQYTQSEHLAVATYNTADFLAYNVPNQTLVILDIEDITEEPIKNIYHHKNNEWLQIQHCADNNLQTTNKTIVGAINEINTPVNKIKDDIILYVQGVINTNDWTQTDISSYTWKKADGTTIAVADLGDYVLNEMKRRQGFTPTNAQTTKFEYQKPLFICFLPTDDYGNQISNSIFEIYDITTAPESSQYKSFRAVCYGLIESQNTMNVFHMLYKSYQNPKKVYLFRATTANPNLKQNVTDNSLVTTDKTVTGAINELKTRIDNIDTFDVHICTAAEVDPMTNLPNIEDPSTTTFYLVNDGTGNDLFTEYIYINDTWEVFGGAKIDVSGKQDKTDTNLTTTNQTVVGGINELNNTQDKIKNDVILYFKGAMITDAHVWETVNISSYEWHKADGTTIAVADVGAYVWNEMLRRQGYTSSQEVTTTFRFQKPMYICFIGVDSSNNSNANRLFQITNIFTEAPLQKGFCATCCEWWNSVTKSQQWILNYNCSSGSFSSVNLVRTVLSNIDLKQSRIDGSISIAGGVVPDAINLLNTTLVATNAEVANKQNQTDNTFATTAKTVKGAIDELKGETTAANASISSINTTLGKKQNQTDNTFATTAKTVKGAISELKTGLNTANTNISSINTSISTINTTLGTKQNSTDNTFTTTAKTVKGAINELKSGLNTANSNIQSINSSIQSLNSSIDAKQSRYDDDLIIDMPIAQAVNKALDCEVTDTSYLHECWFELDEKGSGAQHKKRFFLVQNFTDPIIEETLTGVMEVTEFYDGFNYYISQKFTSFQNDRDSIIQLKSSKVFYRAGISSDEYFSNVNWRPWYPLEYPVFVMETEVSHSGNVLASVNGGILTITLDSLRLSNISNNPQTIGLMAYVPIKERDGSSTAYVGMATNPNDNTVWYQIQCMQEYGSHIKVGIFNVDTGITLFGGIQVPLGYSNISNSY